MSLSDWDVNSDRQHGRVFRSQRLGLLPQSLLHGVGTVGRSREFGRRHHAIGEIEADLHIVAIKLQCFGAGRFGQQPCAQGRGADCVGLGQNSVAPRLEARQGHREGEADHQRQQAQHGAGQRGHAAAALACVPRAEPAPDFARSEYDDETGKEDRRKRIGVKIEHGRAPGGPGGIWHAGSARSTAPGATQPG
jgi:hypothetical protein